MVPVTWEICTKISDFMLFIETISGQLSRTIWSLAINFDSPVEEQYSALLEDNRVLNLDFEENLSCK